MRILLVEDEPKIATPLARGLTQEGFAVDICTEGRECLEMVQYDPYDCVILDRMLVGPMDGSEVCARLRKSGVQTPIIMLTAKGAIVDKIAGLNSGADDYLAKPFDFNELVARIRALLRRPAVVQPVVIQHHDLTLNTISRVVTRAGQNVQLTMKEFTLLEFLLVRKGHVVPKEAIIGHLWGNDAIVVANNVEVYIRTLRNKLDRAFPEREPLLKTVYGYGYKIV